MKMKKNRRKTIAMLAMCALLLCLAACGEAAVEVPEGKEEAYSFTGTWLSEDKETVVNYILHCYTDQTLVMECHENEGGTWQENEDGSLTLTIGGVTYESSKSAYTGKYSFRFNDKIGSQELTVRLETASDDSKAGSETDEMLIQVYANEVHEMVRQYQGRQGEIIFYGGSNFVKWETLEKDMEGYTVQNKSFGGSNDPVRYHFIQELIYDSEPAVMVYMSSSNDWTSGKSLEEVVAFKEQMFNEMGEKLPDTVFVILSATPNPLRYFGEYHEKMVGCDQWIKEYCEIHDNFEFLDVVPALSLDNGANPNATIWIEDSLHLNADGYEILTGVVRDKLATVCDSYGLFQDQ